MYGWTKNKKLNKAKNTTIMRYLYKIRIFADDKNELRYG